SLSHPPGFTLDVSVIRNENGQSANEIPVGRVRIGSYGGYDPGGESHGLLNGRLRERFRADYRDTRSWEAVGNSGGILYVGEATVSRKRILWDSVSTLIDRWNGEVVVLGDFNEVRNIDERRGSCFNPTSARVFDQFISASGLVDVKMKGYTFTWSHPSGSKMSKLDQFLVFEGIFSSFPSITAVCLGRHLSDHRPIILYEDLKVRIRAWIKDKRSSVSSEKYSIKKELSDIDRLLDGGDVFDSNVLRRSELHHNLYTINQMESKEYLQKSKIKWAIEGDENSKFFHGLINKKCSQLAIRGVFVDGI
nr:RNA-directed DNA polymerase, eukaryota [Tanacetum cinerariifolium]